MLRRLVAILTFSRRTESLTGRAKIIDGDTIVVADQLVRLHGIDAPELDQTFSWRGQQIVCGTVVGRPRGPHGRGRRPLRGGRTGPAWSPRSTRPTWSTSAAGWCRRGGRIGGTRRITSTPRTRPTRPGGGCGGATFVRPWEWHALSPSRRRQAPNPRHQSSNTKLVRRITPPAAAPPSHPDALPVAGPPPPTATGRPTEAPERATTALGAPPNPHP
jgi:hypothetical protein